MNFKEAQKKSIMQRFIGFTIATPALISIVVSILKMLYFRLDSGTQASSVLFNPFKQIVSSIYQHTQFLNFFWVHSPTPNQIVISDTQNIYFAATYVIFFVGLAFMASGKKLNVRLAKISHKIEDQLIAESIKGNTNTNRRKIEETTEIPSTSIFNQIHQLYIAPVLTAVIGAIIIKLFGV